MINKVTLIGFLGNDPDFRTLENGTPVCRLSVATSDSYKDKDGNWQNQTEWHNVIAWRELAERCSQNLRKGNLVFVDGKISHRKYTDQNGVEKSMTDIVANNVRLLEKKERGGNDFVPVEPYQAPARQGQSVSAPEPQGGDDSPF
jgi:single-strand DNA-binding protein